jgi:hypothetical protein
MNDTKGPAELTRNDTVELRLRALLKHRTIHFARVVGMPFQPAAGMVWHDGPPPPQGTSYRLTCVLWLAGERRFLAHVEDDVHAGEDFGEDVQAVRTFYEARGWQEVLSLPFRLVEVDVLAPAPAPRPLERRAAT